MLQQQKYCRADIGVGFEDRRKDCPIVITLVQSTTRRGSATKTKQLQESMVSLTTFAPTPESILSIRKQAYYSMDPIKHRSWHP